jgi:hypothetical protein
MRQPSVLAYSIPASVLLFCWVTIGVSATYDVDTVAIFGCPWSWYTPSLVSSGGYEIAIGRLTADLLIYVLLVHLIWMVLRNRMRHTSRWGQLFKWLLSLGATLSLVVSLIAFSIDPHLTWRQLTPAIPQNVPTNLLHRPGSSTATDPNGAQIAKEIIWNG